MFSTPIWWSTERSVWIFCFELSKNSMTHDKHISGIFTPNSSKLRLKWVMDCNYLHKSWNYYEERHLWSLFGCRIVEMVDSKELGALLEDFGVLVPLRGGFISWKKIWPSTDKLSDCFEERRGTMTGRTMAYQNPFGMHNSCFLLKNRNYLSVFQK